MAGAGCGGSVQYKGVQGAAHPLTRGRPFPDAVFQGIYDTGVFGVVCTWLDQGGVTALSNTQLVGLAFP